MIKEQTTFEQAQGISYTFSMVEVSIKIVPARRFLMFFCRNHKLSNQEHIQRPKCQYQGKT